MKSHLGNRMTTIVPAPTTHTTAQNPFPGLRPFDYADYEYFFGRERESKAVYRLLEFSRFIAVIGSSGSGKSSLVRAGLRPLLEAEAASGGRNWRIATMHPGTDPAAALAQALGELTKESARQEILENLQNSTLGLADIRHMIPELVDDPVFLIVDQFEELFRYAAGGGATLQNRTSEPIWRERAAHFVELLLEATRKQSANVFVLITMRSDFVGDCAQFAYLPEAVSAAQFLVPGLNPRQREDIIRKPIEKAAREIPSASIEPALVDRLLNDASDEVDQLPVLQHCLARLWERSAPSHVLALDVYAAIGKIEGALSQHADELMAEDDLRGRTLAVEQVFRALSEVDKEGRATRRPLELKQLEAETGVSKQDVRAVVNRFRSDDCSFCTPSFAAVPKDELKPNTFIDVGHEALLRKWKCISRTPDEARLEKREPGWLWLEKRDGNTYEWLLNVAAAKAGSTLPPEQVDERLEWWHSMPRTAAWAKRYGGDIARVEQLFSDSVKKRDEERSKREREEHSRAVRKRWAVALPIVFAIIGSGMSFWASRTYQQIAQLKSQTKTLHAEALGAFAAAHSASFAAHSATIVWQKERARAKRYYDLARTLLQQTQRQDQALRVSNQELESTAQTLGRSDMALSLKAHALRSEIQTEKIATARTFFENGISALQQGDAADAEVFLAAAYHKDPKNSAASILLASARDQVQSREATIRFNHRSPILSDAYAADSADPIFATGQEDGATTVWDAQGHRLAFLPQSDAVTALAFDPSGNVLAAGRSDGSLTLYSIKEHRGVTFADHHERINAVVFSPKGGSLATTSMDGTVKLWSSSDHQLLHEFNLDSDPQGFPALGYALQFTPDGNKLVACTDTALRVWNLSGYRALNFKARAGEPNGPPGCRHLAISRDGSRVVTDGDLPGGVEFYSLTTLDWNGRQEIASDITSLNFDPSNSSNRRIVVAGDDGAVALTDWGMRPALLFNSRGNSTGAERVVGIAFSTDGSNLFMAEAGGTVSIYNFSSESKLTLRAQDAVSSLSVTPGGREFATTGERNGSPDFVVWRVPRSAHSVVLSPSSSAVTAISASPNNRFFASGSRDGTAYLWKAGAAIEQLPTLRLASDGAWVDHLRFDGAGEWLAESGGRHIRLWHLGGMPRLDADITSSSEYLRFSDAWPTASGNLVLAQREKALADLDGVALPISEVGLGMSRRGGKISMVSDWLRNATDVLPIGAGRVVVFSKVSGYGQFRNLEGKKTYFTSAGIAQVAYCPGTGRVLLGGTWGGLTLVSAASASRLRYWQDHRPVLASGAHARVSALACSDDGAWLASAGAQDGMIRIWSVAHVLDTPPAVRPSPFAVLRLGYPIEISQISFSPQNGRFVLTLTSDGHTQLWSRESGELLATFALPGADATAASFVFGGSGIAVGYSDGRLAFYPLAPSAAVATTMHGVLQDIKGLQFEPQGLVREAFAEIGGH